MEWLADFATNKCLICALIAWFVCQSYKGFTLVKKKHQWRLRYFLGAGGMPSSHTATVVAVTVSIGILHGFGTPLFAACLVFSIIVMHDAAGVRRETGKQSVIINEMVSQRSENDGPATQALKELVGHSPIEVIVGCAVGVLSGMIALFL